MEFLSNSFIAPRLLFETRCDEEKNNNYSMIYIIFTAICLKYIPFIPVRLFIVIFFLS